MREEIEEKIEEYIEKILEKDEITPLEFNILLDAFIRTKDDK